MTQRDDIVWEAFASNFDHAARHHLETFARMGDALSLRQRTEIGIRADQEGLFRIRGLGLKAMSAILQIRFDKAQRASIMAQVVADKRPVQAEDMWKALRSHLVSGRDTSDPSSAGGFNAAELRLLVDIARPMLEPSLRRTMASMPEVAPSSEDSAGPSVRGM